MRQWECIGLVAKIRLSLPFRQTHPTRQKIPRFGLRVYGPVPMHACESVYTITKKLHDVAKEILRDVKSYHAHDTRYKQEYWSSALFIIDENV